jgi:hypothetical protein
MNILTGEAPTDPTVGFLPPNNGTSGQGYVTFTMKPKQDTPHLSIIHANASIYFDQNEPIDTPNIANTVNLFYSVLWFDSIKLYQQYWQISLTHLSDEIK